MSDWRITPSRLLALIATIVFAVCAFQGHQFISVPTGLTFFAAAFIV